MNKLKDFGLFGFTSVVFRLIICVCLIDFIVNYSVIKKKL